MTAALTGLEDAGQERKQNAASTDYSDAIRRRPQEAKIERAGGEINKTERDLMRRVLAIQEVQQRLNNMLGYSEWSTEERNGRTRRERAGQRWDESWILRVEQSVNSRQQRKMARGVRKMLTCERGPVRGVFWLS